MEGYIYLASPYSHPDPKVREDQFVKAAMIAGQLMRDGLIVFSPITHSYPIEIYASLPGGWDFWKKYDDVFVKKAQKVMVACIDGWKESKGVSAEVKIAEDAGIPVEYLTIEESTMSSIKVDWTLRWIL